MTSGRFGRITVAEMQSGCARRYGSAAFSAMNFAFFESYDPSTELSFPAKAGGRMLTGGSGPYGPGPNPKDPYYHQVVLRALTWGPAGATITRYDPSTGVPLSDAGVRDGVVTYAYDDHPSRALAGDPPNRYQLVGVVGGTRPTLAILTVDRTTLETGARLLREHGVTGDVLTFDGGVSTFLWAAATGDLELPRNSSSGPSALPHYLCVHHR